MRCARIKLGNGATEIVCGHLPVKATALCASCRARPSTKFCDFPMRNAASRRKPCDAPICDSCATSLGPNCDLCPEHSAEWRGLPEVPILAARRSARQSRDRGRSRRRCCARSSGKTAAKRSSPSSPNGSFASGAGGFWHGIKLLLSWAALIGFSLLIEEAVRLTGEALRATKGAE